MASASASLSVIVAVIVIALDRSARRFARPWVTVSP
jgi:hypothetical protein